MESYIVCKMESFNFQDKHFASASASESWFSHEAW